jgi:hypothetical protein
MLLLYSLISCARSTFNHIPDVLIGSFSPPYGAVVVTEDLSVLDLSNACGDGVCPSILIFSGKQWGTINIKGCKTGRTYTLVNKSKVDLGIVIQQEGGRFGSKAIARFDVVSCFCVEADSEDSDGENVENTIASASPTILCR